MAGYEEDGVVEQIGTWAPNYQTDPGNVTYQEGPTEWRRSTRQQSNNFDPRQPDPMTVLSGLSGTEFHHYGSAYGHSDHSNYVYPSPSQGHTAIPYPQVQQQALPQDQPRPTYAQAAVSRVGTQFRTAQTPAGFGTLSNDRRQGGQLQQQSDASTTAQVQWPPQTQGYQSNSTRPHQPAVTQPQPQLPSYAEAARLQHQPQQAHLFAFSNGTPPAAHVPNAPQQYVAARRPLKPRVDPLQQPTAHLDMRRQPPSAVIIPRELSKENMVNIDQSYMSNAPVKQMVDWNNVAKLPGERGKAVNSAAYNSAARNVQSPTKSTTSSSRRSKLDIVNSSCEHVCDQCQAGFDDLSDLKHHCSSVHKHYDDREYPCQEQSCEERFLYPKDRIRHTTTKHAPEAPRYFCLYQWCQAAVKGIKRLDNYNRHMRDKHGHNTS